MRSVTITLPLPNAKLHAHASGHWYNKNKSVAKAKEEAMYTAMQVTKKTFLRATISYAFFVPDRIHRDESNLVQMCKPYVDGFVLAKLIAGDNWQRLHVVEGSVAVDAENPRVEITITDWETK